MRRRLFLRTVRTLLFSDVKRVGRARGKFEYTKRERE